MRTNWLVTRADLRDLLAMTVTGRCWVCGQDENDPGMVISLGTHLAMHRSDSPGWYPGKLNPAIQPPGFMPALRALRVFTNRQRR